MYIDDRASYDEVDESYIQGLIDEMAHAFFESGEYVEAVIKIDDDPRVNGTSELIVLFEQDGQELTASYKYKTDNSKVKDFPAFDEADVSKTFRWAQRYYDECNLSDDGVADTEYWLNMTYR